MRKRLRMSTSCRFCGEGAYAKGGDQITLSMRPTGFVWWHPECVEWCDWEWEG